MGLLSAFGRRGYRSLKNGEMFGRLPYRETLRARGFDVDRPLYHGTASDFAEFDLAHGGRNFGGRDSRMAVSLTSEPWNASDYATGVTADGLGANVRPVFAKGRFKPVRESDLMRLAGEETTLTEQYARAMEQARNEGYDGIALHGVARGLPTVEYKVFPDESGRFGNIVPMFGR